MVYAFIDEWSEAQGGKSKAIEIPTMQFVRAGLAIEQVQQGAEARCFLIEELISDSDSSKGGSFRKYLNNTSAKPCSFTDEEDIRRAKFLAFAQHVQYFKTKKHAYVADFQGGDELLTDPQILTNGKLGFIFADGNMPGTFAKFEDDHFCNHFCNHFGLLATYGEDCDLDDNSSDTSI